MSPVPTLRFARPSTRIVLVTATAALTAVTATACSTSSSHSSNTAATGGGSGSGKTIQVVAAENFWGSIASQLGGSHVKVTSIITNPNTDPHAYEPTAADARTVA
ncbi:metal ABC transporter solute-binding protein, Zn/Mn family [Streptomyces lasalocidi]